MMHNIEEGMSENANSPRITHIQPACFLFSPHQWYPHTSSGENVTELNPAGHMTWLWWRLCREQKETCLAQPTPHVFSNQMALLSSAEGFSQQKRQPREWVTKLYHWVTVQDTHEHTHSHTNRYTLVWLEFKGWLLSDNLSKGREWAIWHVRCSSAWS